MKHHLKDYSGGRLTVQHNLLQECFLKDLGEFLTSLLNSEVANGKINHRRSTSERQDLV
jgi:hypothetical protein